MTIVIDGTGAILGRLATFVAKEALKGEDIAIINCDRIIISGNKEDLKQKLEQRRSRVGSSQKGPKYHKTSEKLVKRAIRGMLPDHRRGRGRVAFKRIMCYTNTPKQFENIQPLKLAVLKRPKTMTVKELIKQ